jgi:hypothetical protein
MSLPGTTFGTLPDDSVDICSSSRNNRGVWYTVTPGFTRNITFATSVASFGHEIVVFSGNSCDTATCDGSMQVATLQSRASITFVAEARTKYYILVTGYNRFSDAFDMVGTFSLKISGDGNTPTQTPVLEVIRTPTRAPLPVYRAPLPVYRPVRRMKRGMGMMSAGRGRYYAYEQGRSSGSSGHVVLSKGKNIFADIYHP